MNDLPLQGTDGRDHALARELAAARPDGFLTLEETAWLDAHLDRCNACVEVAAAYAGQRSLFAAARASMPQAPRDLWARTAATIEAQARHGARGPRRRRFGGWVMAPLAASLVVAVAVGAGLLNGVPGTGDSPVQQPGATPIALAAGEIVVLSPGEDGTLEVRRETVDEVCPEGASSCGLNPATEVTQTERLANANPADAYISPDESRMILIQRGEGTQGVYIVPLRPAGADAPTPAPPTATPTPTPDPTATPTASPSLAPSPSPAGSASPATLPSPSPSAPVDASASPSPDSTDSPSSSPSDSPAVSPSDSPESPSPTVEPTPEPTPSVAVTPRPDGALEIARDVVLVGNAAAYSPDGTRFAFSARPADGSAGPDVYLWQTGDTEAAPITSDGASRFSGWLDDEILISRVVGNTARTIILTVDTGEQRAAHPGPMWRPTVDPLARTGVWWDGSVKAARDKLTWVPDEGRLVLEPWPQGDEDTQVLAATGITDFQVGWDEEGTVLAVWTTSAAAGEPGVLTLYNVDPGTGRVDLAAPRLADEPAYEGFGIQTGRLTWSAPAEGGDTTVQVLAWSGDRQGRLEILAEGGTSVVR